METGGSTCSILDYIKYENINAWLLPVKEVNYHLIISW